MTKNKRRFILHIGTEKTGTSTIQNVFKRNSTLLKNIGVAYISSYDRIDARTLTAAAVGDVAIDDYLTRNKIELPEDRQAFRQEVLSHFRQEFLTLDPSVHTVILSSEHFHSRLRESFQLEWLKDFLFEYTDSLDILIYLRKQVDLVESFYSTQLKNGSVRSLEETALVGCRFDNYYYNYHQILELWSRVFGEESITVRIFEPNRLVNSDVTQDFIASCGLSLVASELDGFDERFNESIQPFGQVLLRLLNDRSERFEYTDLKQDISLLFSGKGQRLEGTILDHVQQTFIDVNDRVCKKWFPDQECLFSPLSPDKKTGTLVALNDKQLSVVAAVLPLLETSKDSGILKLDHYAPLLRDIAISLEHTDLSTAIRHMELAWRIRPNGPVINRKLGEYSIQSKSFSARLRDAFKRNRL